MVLDVEVFKLFVLVMVRISALLVSAPVLGSRNFPIRAKAGLAALMAILITPSLPALAEPIPTEMLPYGVMALGEVSIGLLMGFVMTLIFSAVQVAGQVIDMLSGFALMNVFNPALETQVPIFGFFMYVVAALYLLAIDGHHIMIRALVSTFTRIPLGGFMLRPELLAQVQVWGRGMFLDGLLIAAPVASALLLAYVSMGLMGRVVPQIHLFVVGFPVAIAMAMLMMASFLGIYVGLLDGMFDHMFDGLVGMIEGMT